MKRLSALITFLYLFFSCSIIKDDDITTKEDFDNNVLVERVEISDNLFGSSTSAVYSYSNTGRIENIFWASMPPNYDEEFFGGRNLGKLRFNLFFEANDPEGVSSFYTVSTSFTYDGAGRVNSISNRYQSATGGIGTILFQQFNYSYDTSGKLFEIETLNNQHDLVKKTTTTDSLIYSGNKITSVVRTTETPLSTFQQTITVKYSGIGVVSEVKKGNTTTMNGCSINQKNFYCYFSDTNGGGYSNSQIVYGEGTKPVQVTITEQRFEDNGSTGAFGDQTGRPPDYFFVSPYVFTPNLFENGRDLAQIFIDDWWIKGVGNNSTLEIFSNETVTLDFSYTLKK